ncbi:MAG: efflux transporter outer membrane subunit [Hyphomonadaceae bacterium]
MAGSALALAACVPTMAAAPNPAAPDTLATARSFDAPPAAWPADQWWRAYNDPQLDTLMEEGLEGSPTLAIASARVAQAQANLQSTESLRLPSADAQAAVHTARISANATGLPQSLHPALPQGWNDQGQVGLGLAYQLDFFGRNRAAFAAATSDVRAAEAEAASARLQLSTAIALAYADLQRLAADRAAAEEIVRLREQSLALVQQRYDSQLEHEGQLAQARSELASARSDLIAVEGNLRRARYVMATLLGRGPDRGLDIALPANVRVAPLGAPADINAELIGRRPDLVAARVRAEAASRRIDVARADFYPNVNLTALVGLQSIGLDVLSEGGSRFGQVGPAVTLPIFSGGRIEGAYRGARAEYDASVALYDQTLIHALNEVADAIAARRTLDTQLIEARAALAASEQSYRIARHRYEGGLSPYIEVLTVENRLVQHRRALATLETQAFVLDVALVRALGGGFNS